MDMIAVQWKVWIPRRLEKCWVYLKEQRCVWSLELVKEQTMESMENDLGLNQMNLLKPYKNIYMDVTFCKIKFFI